MRRKMKLTQSIYIMLFLCTFVPMFIWIVFSFNDSRQRMENVVRNNIEAIGGSQVMSIYNFYEGRKEAMETIAAMDMVQEAILNYDTQGHSEELDVFFAKNEEQKTHIASVSVLDKAFHVVGSSQKYDLAELSDFQYLDNRYHQGEFFMGNSYERETDSGKKHLVAASVGIYHEEELIGYLVVEIDCDYFNRLRLQTDFLEDGTLYLMDGKDQIITAGTAKEWESRELPVTSEEERREYSEAMAAYERENQSEGVIYYEVSGEQYMTYISDIPELNWTILITENMSSQWKSNHSVYLVIAMEGLAVALILVYVQIMITHKLIAPVKQIVGTLKKVQDQKDFSIRTGVCGDDEAGLIAKGIDELLDYAERAEKEEKDKHEHQEFLSAAMLENMPSGYHRCLPDVEKGFPFIQLGSHIEEILGWTAEEIKNDLGNCYKNLIWPEDMEVASKYADMVRNVGGGNGYDTSVYRMKHKDGTYRWITDATMFVDLGEESFFQGVIADITQYVEGMEEAKQLAEASSHAKTDFLSQMSHDIRTPMNAIIGFTNLAKECGDYDQIKSEYIPKIETASNQLLMLINDVLEMNSIETGNMIFRKVPMDMYALMQDVMTLMQLQAEKKQLELTADINITDRYIVCDESRFQRVFLNLTSNAIKFTPEGGKIKIRIDQMSEPKNGMAEYQFKITDTGIGMAPEFAPLVFEPFERERTSTVSRVEGTGLGLAIVKRIVDAAGGTIFVESAPNAGTTFTIRLSMEMADSEQIFTLENKDDQATEELSRDDLQKRFEGKKILLVEDNEFNRAIAETVLENVGFVVESAEDGSIAVQMVKDAPSPDYYDVVLMDIQMPIMDGYEATKVIRDMEDTRRNVKILAVTANAFESDRENAKKAGMDGHIPKPLDIDVLYKTLLELTD